MPVIGSSKKRALPRPRGGQPTEDKDDCPDHAVRSPPSFAWPSSGVGRPRRHRRRPRTQTPRPCRYLPALPFLLLFRPTAPPWPPSSWIASTALLLPPFSRPVAAASAGDTSSPRPSEGRSHLRQGRRLFQRGDYEAASFHLWRAVLLHSSDESYRADDAFGLFLQCHRMRGRLVDGLVFVAAEGFARGQVDLGEMYLERALEAEGGHEVAGRLKALVSTATKRDVATLKEQLLEIRNEVDISATDSHNHNNSNNNNNNNNVRDDDDDNDKHDDFDPYGNPSAKPQINPQRFSPTLLDQSPEELYNLGTHYFNAKNFVEASQIFEWSCQKSNYRLSVACTNAVYLRTNLCDWGYLGRGFERDMAIVTAVTKREVELYRSLQYLDHDDDTDDYLSDGYDNQHSSGIEAIRAAGIGHFHNHRPRQPYPPIIHWKRSTSVHPHMMLGYPLDHSHSILKRYVSESMAGMDELRARLRDDGTIADRPADLPYSVADMQHTFLERHKTHLQRRERDGTPLPPVKVGFVSSGFNSKAVLYLSHDLFRFFDPELVEIHVFSTGAPDHPQFLRQTMRGVDWRQRVIDTVDYFHDVRELDGDHIALARFIHEKQVQILIEWDGYARQGERAMGLMALRPCPVQILHQEFLATSGAQYVDYIVTDKVVSPMRLEGLYTEKFLYLPHHFFSKGHAVQAEVVPPKLEYVPKESAAAEFRLGVGSPQENACLASHPLGANEEDEQAVSFVYCNFNKFLKNNPETMRSWIRILQHVPNSILCLLENPTEGIPNLRKFVNDVTAEEGNGNEDDGRDATTTTSSSNINARIHFLPWEKNPFDHQQRSHSLCNAMLDSHPYNGHTTAQDALYAGVPIVTRSDGDDMASRVTTSSNVILGLEELNAHHGIEEYERIAIRLGKDEEFFRSVRTKLIETCLQTNPMHPYWDVPRYVKNLEKGLVMVWEKFLRGEKADHVEVRDEDGWMEGGTTEEELVRREKKRREMKKLRKLVLLDDYNKYSDEGEL